MSLVLQKLNPTSNPTPTISTLISCLISFTQINGPNRRQTQKWPGRSRSHSPKQKRIDFPRGGLS
jgi:hypothetical protein